MLSQNNKDDVMVQWEDDNGSLFEANICRRQSNGRVTAYVKQRSAEDKESTIDGTHSMLWQAEAPPAEPVKLKYTIKRKSEEYGCPRDFSTQFLNFEVE